MARTSSKKYLRIIEAAKKASLNAYAPYSKVRVGAALRTKNGKIFKGCNVENASLPLGLCAEKNAVGSAVAAHETDFRYLALYSPEVEFITPCGSCAQFLSEFNNEILIISTGHNNDYRIYYLKDILPLPYKEGSN